jgi:thiamine biosynthesis lipoprotein
MGTSYSIKALHVADADKLHAQVEARLVQVNDLMSTYISDSEVSRLNQLPVGDVMSLSQENQMMLALAERLMNESGGKFDVTLGPLIALWGFGADPSRVDVPAQTEISAALAQMGLDALKLDGAEVRKLAPVAVDFSAYAKGFGVDELARLVEQAGSKDYLVEIGGELKASGVNQRGQVWRIGIETPEAGIRVPYTAVPLKDLAMATSGDYRNYFEVDGKRYSHTLDPATGYPITHNLASVTVLAPTAAEADGYATAINVMGPITGMRLANELNLPILVILKAPDGFEMRTSQAFDTYLEEIAGQ